ncbi:MAG TPA: twin-arginine translocase subunit TatC [Candidatus Azoamicus sp.]
MNIHFLELRKRIIYVAFFYIIIFGVFFYYSDIIYDLFSLPIKSQLPIGSSIIATNVTSTFLVPLKLAFNLSLLVVLPYIIFHLWEFISPGLYKHEKVVVKPFLFFSIFLFFLGIFFAFYIICPLALNFFMTCSPSNVVVMVSINNYIEFMSSVILACGISFQIPLVIYFLINVGIFEKKDLVEKRSYVIIFAFILGMLLTPPDVVSQVLLAVPIWFLFEVGLFFSK